MEHRIKAILSIIAVAAVLGWILANAPFDVPDSVKAGRGVEATNWLAASLNSFFGPSAAIGIVAGLGAAGVLAQIWPLLPKPSPREKKPAKPKNAPARQTQPAAPTAEQAAEQAAALAAARASAEEDGWPTTDYIAFSLGGSDTFTYRLANEVLQSLKGCENQMLSQEDFFEAQRLWKERWHQTAPQSETTDRLSALSSPPTQEQDPKEMDFNRRLQIEALALIGPNNTQPIRDAVIARHYDYNGFGAPLDHEVIDKAVALAEEMQRRSTPHGERIRPVALARKARERGRDWSNDPSHLGGLPRLGDAPWPRGKDGLPLHFVAQIDLGEVAAQCPESPLPHEGSLAFFVGDGAVVHVPPGNFAPTPAPADLWPAFTEGGYPFPEVPGPRTHALFPFWPLEPIGLKLPAGTPVPDEGENHEEIWEAQREALKARVPSVDLDISRSDTSQTWWYGAQYVARLLREGLSNADNKAAYHLKALSDGEAYRAKLEKERPRDQAKIDQSLKGAQYNHDKLAAIHAQSAALPSFVRQFDEFVAGRDPWSLMRADEAEVLGEVLIEARKSYGEVVDSLPYKTGDLSYLTWQRMITGDAAALAAMPDPVLNAINASRLPWQGTHQMFGLGTCIQYCLYDHLSDLLLLQLAYDNLAEMKFGDVGVYQFWISPEDAAARRWDRVELTFECS